MDLDKEVSLPPFSSSTNSLNFSYAFVTNSNHLDQVPSLPTQGFGYGFPSNLSRRGNDHLQNPSRSSLYQPQEGVEFGSSSTFPFETYGHYDFPYIDSSSLSPFSSSTNSLNFSSAFVTNSNHLDQVPSLPTQGFGYGFPSNLSRRGNDHLQNPSRSSLYQPQEGVEFGSSSTFPFETNGHYNFPYIDSSSLPPFSSSTNSLNFSSAFVTNSNHLDQVPSLPTQGFGYGFPSNLSKRGNDHLQNPSRSSLYQPQEGVEFGSSSTFPFETNGHYNFPYIDSSSLPPFSSSTNSLNFSSAFVTNSNHLDQVPSLPTQGFGYGFPSNLSRRGNDHLQNPSHSSLYQPQEGVEFGSSSTFPFETNGHYNFPYIDSSSLPPFSSSTNSLNFSSAFVTNSNHLDQVPSLPTQGFGYGFPSNLSRRGNDHLQNPSHSSLYQPQEGVEFGSSSTFPFETNGHYNFPYIDSSSLPPFSSSSNSRNFSSAFVTNSNHLDQVPSLPTQDFVYGFPSNLSRLGNDHLQNPSHSSLYQPQKGFEFGSSSTFPPLESHQILENRSFHYETYGHYNFPNIGSSSLYQPQKGFEFGSSSTFLYGTYGHHNSSSLSSSSLPLGSDKGKIRENGSDGIRIQDDDNHCEKGERNVEEAVGRTAFGEESSKFRGVRRYTGGFKAFLWDKTGPGKPVHVGVFDGEEEAARAYDLAALKYYGDSATLNFPVTDYGKDLEKMQEMNRTEYLNSIRRTSKGFAKGVSKFRGVSWSGKKWLAKMGKGHDTRSLYLGRFDTEEDAATAYDIAVIKVKGSKATTNFDLRHYNIESIEQSEMIPVGEGASKSLQRIPAKEILKRKTKDVKKPGAFKLEEQSLVVPTNQNTQNIIPPPPQKPSYPQAIYLQGADHGKIEAQNVSTLQEDQSLILGFEDSLPSHEIGFEDSGFLFNGVTDDPKLPSEMLENLGGDFLSPNPSSPTFDPHQNPDAQLEGIPREGSKSNLVDDIINPTAVKATNGSINGLLESDFVPKIEPYTYPDFQSLLCQSSNFQNFPTFPDGLSTGASSGTGSISEAILGSNNLFDSATLEWLNELFGLSSNIT